MAPLTSGTFQETRKKPWARSLGFLLSGIFFQGCIVAYLYNSASESNGDGGWGAGGLIPIFILAFLGLFTIGITCCIFSLKQIKYSSFLNYILGTMSLILAIWPILSLVTLVLAH